MSFTTPLEGMLFVDHNDDKLKMEITSEFSYYTHLVGGSKFFINIPVGFITDFASIPKFLHWLLSPLGKHNKGDVVHDWCYTVLREELMIDLKQCINETDVLIAHARFEENRKLCDAIYREALDVLKVNKVKKEILLEGVTQFGGIALLISKGE